VQERVQEGQYDGGNRERRGGQGNIVKSDQAEGKEFTIERKRTGGYIDNEDE
jgi:hypothetical protein